jgi:hypothetical protein
MPLDPFWRAARRKHRPLEDMRSFISVVMSWSVPSRLLMQLPPKQHGSFVIWLKRELKHDLERLRVELITRGVNIPRIQHENFKRVRSSWYSEMRYRMEAWTRDKTEKVFTAAEQLFAWVKGG